MVLNGVPRSKVLLDWSKWKNLIEFQKNIFEEQNLEKKLYPIYLDNWEIDLLVGPEAVKDFFTFKNLKKNEFKPFLLTELKKLEEEPIPKWLKTYVNDEELFMQADEEISPQLFNLLDDEESIKNEEAKSLYIKKGRNLVN